MSNSNHEISAEGRLIDEGGAYSVRSRQVTVLKNGAVQITYQSFDDYLRDLEFHRSGEWSKRNWNLKIDNPLDKDLLSELPNEILSKIVKNIIPSGERIAIGVDYFGTNQTHIPCGSLNILCVSKSISVIALHVLYGCRSYELVAETNLHSNKEEQGWISHYNVKPMNVPISDRSAHRPAD